MNQIMAAAILFGLATVVIAPLVASSGSQIFSNSASILDVLDGSRRQAGQVVVATHVQVSGNGTAIYLSNIGTEGLGIHAVLVDGGKVPYVLEGQEGGARDVLEAGGLGVLRMGVTGGEVQVVSTLGKFFGFTIT